MFTLDELLIFAVRGGKPDLVRARLAAGANPSYFGRSGSALLEAVSRRQVHLIHLLVEHGANINLVDGRGYGALEYALRTGDTAVIDAVLRCEAHLRAHRAHWREALESHFINRRNNGL